jgi:uncharacterized protein
MILRYLLLIAFVYWVYSLLRRAAAGRGAGGARQAAEHAAPTAAQEFMVSCAHCGVHLPQSDSVSAAGRFYCGEQHRIAGPGAAPR